MKKLTNFKKMHIFFVGIGGISMSGLAKVSILLGAKVTGSDSQNAYIPELANLGCEVFLGHSSDHITEDIDLIVYTGAIKKDNVELVRGEELNIPMLERNEFLGELSAEFKEVIAISGCHGKTTVTSMIANIFTCAKLNPTIHIGGESLNFKTNTVLGSKEYFIVEACEYRESFLALHPTTALILNIDKDHLDYYQTFDNIKLAFNKFAQNSNHIIVGEGVSVIHNNMDIVNNFWQVRNVKITKLGYKFDVYYKNKMYSKITLNTIGKHNIVNSIFAIALAHHYKIPKKYIRKGLATYLGVKRRYERIGDYCGIPVIADYAHHPEEIKNSINGIKERYNNPLIIFQPHTFSRTKTLMTEFVDVLSIYDNVIIYSTYPARELFDPKGSGYTLFKKLKINNKFYAKNKGELLKICEKCMTTNNHDVIVILGAGNLYDKIKEIL